MQRCAWVTEKECEGNSGICRAVHKGIEGVPTGADKKGTSIHGRQGPRLLDPIDLVMHTRNHREDISTNCCPNNSDQVFCAYSGYLAVHGTLSF